jgi:hypothetical protein
MFIVMFMDFFDDFSLPFAQKSWRKKQKMLTPREESGLDVEGVKSIRKFFNPSRGEGVFSIRKFFNPSMISPFKPSTLVFIASNLTSVESIISCSSSFVTVFFCKSFMSLRISSPSSRVQVGLSGGLFGVEVPFFGGMLAKYHFKP